MRGPVALGIAVTFAGYTLAYYGYTLVRGPGVGLLDLLVPGRFRGFPAPTGGGRAEDVILPDDRRLQGGDPNVVLGPPAEGLPSTPPAIRPLP